MATRSKTHVPEDEGRAEVFQESEERVEKFQQLLRKKMFNRGMLSDFMLKSISNSTSCFVSDVKQDSEFIQVFVPQLYSGT